MSLLLYTLILWRVWAILGIDPASVAFAGFPLFLVLGQPTLAPQPSSKLCGSGVALFVLGFLSDSFLLMGLGLTLCLKAETILEPPRQATLCLPFFCVPWLLTDLQVVGWYFRLTAAWVTGKLLPFLGIPARQEGTQVFFEDIVLIVEPACSGLNFLQAWLIAGIVLLVLGHKLERLSSRTLVPLVGLTWLANTTRVLALALAASHWGVAAVEGSPHLLGGWLLFLVFFFLWQKRVLQ